MKPCEIKELFSSFNTNDAFVRISNKYILDIYIGVDELGRFSFLMKSDQEFNIIKPTEILLAYVKQRKDGKWIFSLTLTDNLYEDMFMTICTDLINFSSKTVNITAARKLVVKRYEQWIYFLKVKKYDGLSSAEIKGLIGELVFLKEKMFAKYGVEKSINSWIGPLYTDQDFVVDSTWYEVKSTASGSVKVTVSSVEQLDTHNDGHLVVIFLDKTSQTDSNQLSLNELVKDIENTIEEDNLRIKFNLFLLSMGYYHKSEYDGEIFKLKKIEQYKVSNDFPCIRQKDIPNGVMHIKYDLLLNSISKYKEEE